VREGAEGDRATVGPWRWRAASTVLPLALAQAVIDGARMRDVRAGGCFSVHGMTVVVWSGEGGRARPIGSFSLRWHAPRRDSALVYEVAWDPGCAGSEAAVCCALRLRIARPAPA
jgi:hypothetical protein